MSRTYLFINASVTGGVDNKTVKVSTDDLIADFLETKIVIGSNKLTKTTLNPAGNETLSLDVDQTNIDHDQLLNFVVNEHVNHSLVEIATGVDSGLTGGGNITATRNLSIDINGTTDKASPVSADEILLSDSADANSLKKADIASLAPALDHQSLSGAGTNTHTQIDTFIASKAQANGLASLDANAKIPSSQLPALALTDVFVVVDIAARNALTIGSGAGEVQEGDVVIVQDADGNGTQKGYIYDGTLYQEINESTVISINGETGVVTLSTDEVSEGATNLYFTTARARTAAVVNSTAGNETDQAPSVGAIKTYITSQIETKDEASEISYNNTTSGLTATNVQAALDEIDGITDSLDSRVTTIENSLPVGDVVGTTDTQTLTNKTIDADLNTISNLAHGAEVDNPTSGVHGVTGSVVGTSDTQTLTNKTISAIDNTISNIANASIAPSAAINVTKLHDGSVDNTEFGYLDGVTSSIQTQLNAKFEDPTTTEGDLIYNNGSITTRLGRGTAGQVLTATASTIAWQDIVDGSAGDLEEGSFSAANNQSTAANVTGFNFSNAVVRSFRADVSVEVDAGTDLFEKFTIEGIQKGSGWDISYSGVGDDSGFDFAITSLGQMQYFSSNYASFVSATIKYRAVTTSI